VEDTFNVLHFIEPTSFVIPVKTGNQHSALKSLPHLRKMLKVLGPRFREDDERGEFDSS